MSRACPRVPSSKRKGKSYESSWYEGPSEGEGKGGSQVTWARRKQPLIEQFELYQDEWKATGARGVGARREVPSENLKRSSLSAGGRRLDRQGPNCDRPYVDFFL